MLVIEKKCKVCKTVKSNKQLLNRIYQSSHFVPHSKDTLLKISEETGIHYRGLLNHVKRHQFIDSQDYQDAMLQKADRDAEKKAVVRAVQATSAIQTVIDKGHARLENEEITVNTDQLIRASQIKMQEDAKKKDQDIMAASLAFFMSGESTANNERVYKDADITYPDDSTRVTTGN